jgi:hypothetical protein
MEEDMAMAEKKEIFVDEDRYKSLCLMEGKMDALITFLKHEDEEGSALFSNRETIRAIIGVYE